MTHSLTPAFQSWDAFLFSYVHLPFPKFPTCLKRQRKKLTHAQQIRSKTLHLSPQLREVTSTSSFVGIVQLQDLRYRYRVNVYLQLYYSWCDGSMMWSVMIDWYRSEVPPTCALLDTSRRNGLTTVGNNLDDRLLDRYLADDFRSSNSQSGLLCDNSIQTTLISFVAFNGNHEEIREESGRRQKQKLIHTSYMKHVGGVVSMRFAFTRHCAQWSLKMYGTREAWRLVRNIDFEYGRCCRGKILWVQN